MQLLTFAPLKNQSLYLHSFPINLLMLMNIGKIRYIFQIPLLHHHHPRNVFTILTRTHSSETTATAIGTSTQTTTNYSPEEVEKAKKWLEKLSTNTIPKHLFNISYSRSSGPGGQKVNKTSSKATISLEPGQWLDPSVFYWVPGPVQEQLQNGNIRYATKNKGMVIQCDTSRNREENLEECFERLVREIKSSVHFASEATEEDKEKWEQLEQDFKERKKYNKKKTSEKKQARSKKFDW